MMSRVRFGIDVRRQLTGADLYVRIFQICALLPLPYIFLAGVHPPVLSTRSPFAMLFDVGICALPRVETLALSYIYRATLSEVAVYFVILVIATALGFAAAKVLRGNPEASIKFHKLVASLLILDLAIRIIPVRANYAFGIPAAAAGLVIRAVCLYLVIRDLKAASSNQQ
jgi:hypothetical protein